MQDTCEVCHEPVIDPKKLPKEIQDKVYRPAAGESYNIDEELADPEGFGE